MKCKYCGHEYSKEVIRYCPKCGKNLVDDEANNPQTEVINDAATTVIDNNSNSGSSKSLGEKFGIFAGITILGLLVVGLIFIGFEKITGEPLRQQLFGIEDVDLGKKMYKKVVKEVKEAFPHINVDTEKFNKKHIFYRGLKNYDIKETDLTLYLELYIITVPTTLHFSSLGDRTCDLKFWVYNCNKADNEEGIEMYGDSFPIPEGIHCPGFWGFANSDFYEFFDFIDGFDYEDKDYLEVIKSVKDAAELVCDDMQAEYNKCNKSDITGSYAGYWEYYVNANSLPGYFIANIQENESIFRSLYPDLFIRIDNDTYNYDDYYDDEKDYQEDDWEDDDYDEEYNAYDLPVEEINSIAIKTLKESIPFLDINYPDISLCNCNYIEQTYLNENGSACRGLGDPLSYKCIVTVPITISFEYIGEKKVDLYVPVFYIIKEEIDKDYLEYYTDNDLIRGGSFWGYENLDFAFDCDYIDEFDNIDVVKSREKVVRLICKNLIAQRKDKDGKKKAESWFESDDTYCVYDSFFGRYIYSIIDKFNDQPNHQLKTIILNEFIHFLDINYETLYYDYPKVCE